VIDMIIADDKESREAALEKLLPIQREDFKELFAAMAPYPVTVRLLDPPMHEFLPSEHQLEDELRALEHYRTVVRGRIAAFGALNLAGTSENVTEEQVNAVELRQQAKSFHVDFRQGTLFAPTGKVHNYIRLCFAYYDEANIKAGVLHLKACLAGN